MRTPFTTHLHRHLRALRRFCQGSLAGDPLVLLPQKLQLAEAAGHGGLLSDAERLFEPPPEAAAQSLVLIASQLWECSIIEMDARAQEMNLPVWNRI